jgi:nucleoside-diphosphate-sugar epimerase
MDAAARGERYEIPFGGRMQFHYAPDAARAFVDAAREPGDGAAVANLGGPPVHVGEVVRAIQAAAPGAEITFRDEALPFPEEFEAAAPVRSTGLDIAVRETIEHFRARL